MSIETTSQMWCDGCRDLLTDSEGPRWGSVKSLREHADMAGWIQRPEGDYCGACAVGAQLKVKDAIRAEKKAEPARPKHDDICGCGSAGTCWKAKEPEKPKCPGCLVGPPYDHVCEKKAEGEAKS
jgi:hypothetical protein